MLACQKTPASISYARDISDDISFNEAEQGTWLAFAPVTSKRYILLTAISSVLAFEHHGDSI